MFFGIDIPNIGGTDSSGAHFANPRTVAELAYEAEQAGWDGFFVWDHIGAGWPVPIADPWVLLAAIALRTTRLKLGPMVTPLPRRRPWKVAREAVTIDHLSNGRLIMGVGIGGGEEYTSYHEPDGDRRHAEMLDEALEVLAGLWSGESFSYAGQHYQLDNIIHLPRPVQQRIPVWIAGVWPSKRPMRRAARFDGVFPLQSGLSFTQQMRAADIDEVRRYVREQRTADTPFDVVHWGITEGDDPAADAAVVEPYAEAGVTWWLENLNNDRAPFEQQRERIRRGPPRL